MMMRFSRDCWSFLVDFLSLVLVRRAMFILMMLMMMVMMLVMDLVLCLHRFGRFIVVVLLNGHDPLLLFSGFQHKVAVKMSFVSLLCLLRLVEMIFMVSSLSATLDTKPNAMNTMESSRFASVIVEVPSLCLSEYTSHVYYTMIFFTTWSNCSGRHDNNAAAHLSLLLSHHSSLLCFGFSFVCRFRSFLRGKSDVIIRDSNQSRRK